MGMEIQSTCKANKDSHYERTIAVLENEIENAGNLNEALSIALNCVVKASYAVAGTFWFYDRFGDDRIHPKAIYGGADLGDFSLALGEGIAGQVIAHNKSAIVQDCQSDPRWAGKADKRTGFTTKTMICVPLRYQQYTFGCIQIINKTDDLLFDDKDLQFVEKLASHTAYLFAAQHMLDDFSGISDTDVAEDQFSNEPTFTELFSMASFSDVEKALLKMVKVNSLAESDQKSLMHHSFEMWKIMDKYRALGPRKREFHFFRKD